MVVIIAGISKKMTEKNTVEKLPHHEQQELCRTRTPYRQGKKLTAVKVAWGICILPLNNLDFITLY